MFSFKNMPSLSTLFAAYVSMTSSIMLVRTMVNDLLPEVVRAYVGSFFRYLFKSGSKELTLVIDESHSISKNQIYEASEAYLSTKISSKTERVKIYKTPFEKNITVRMDKSEQIVDYFDGVELKWRHVQSDPADTNPHRLMYPIRPEKKSFELTFHQKHNDLVLNSYLPFVLEKAGDIVEEERALSMFTVDNIQVNQRIQWDSINLEHPATFDTIAMEPEVKRVLIEDLNRFVRRKDFYKRIGRAWKRGYLLYGPPGTGKSSLVAAIANYLRFDVYDLQLANVMRDCDLRKLLLETGNRSILVIEDIDCSTDLPDRLKASSPATEEDGDQTGVIGGRRNMLTLSGLLNFIDGLWSSCGDQRIIIFTTNNKERLDPALLRPGRMDMHIHMSYCTPSGFRLLASNYLGISRKHNLFEVIDGLLTRLKVTPAHVAGELMKSEDADLALQGLVKNLKTKDFNEKFDPDHAKPSEIQTLQTNMQNAHNNGGKQKNATNRRKRRSGRKNKESVTSKPNIIHME